MKKDRWFLMWEHYLVGGFYKILKYYKDSGSDLIVSKWEISYAPQEIDFSKYGDKSFPKGMYSYVRSKGKTVPDTLCPPDEERIYDWLESRKVNDKLGLWDEARKTKLIIPEDKYWITNNIIDLSL